MRTINPRCKKCLCHCCLTGCAEYFAVHNQAAKLTLPDSVGALQYIDVASAQKSKDAFMIMAGVPMLTAGTPPEISIDATQGQWLVEIARDRKALRLKMFDQGTLPECEVVNYER